VISEVYFVANPWPIRHAVADQNSTETHGKPGQQKTRRCMDV